MGKMPVIHFTLTSDQGSFTGWADASTFFSSGSICNIAKLPVGFSEPKWYEHVVYFCTLLFYTPPAVNVLAEAGVTNDRYNVVDGTPK